MFLSKCSLYRKLSFVNGALKKTMTDEIFDFSAIFNRIAAAFQAGEDGVGAYLAELGSVKTTALVLILMTLVRQCA